MKYVMIVMTALLLSACSSGIKTPQVAFGKKCAVNENGQVTYSYVWIYDKQAGLNANKKECESIKND